MIPVGSASSPAESYLQAWHARHPDACRVFVVAGDDQGRSGYRRLASFARSGTSVLDVACGSGLLLEVVRAESPGAHLFGVDLSMSELLVARARDPGAQLSRARAQAMPIADASLDVVVCHMALMLMDHPQDVLLEIRRVLRSGGTFSAVTNRPMAPDPIVKAILRALRPRWERSDKALHPPPLGDARTHEPDALSTLVGAYFSNVVVEPFDVTQYVARRDLWPFLVNSVYGLDAIPASDGAGILNELDLPEPVPWTVPMVQVMAARHDRLQARLTEPTDR